MQIKHIPFSQPLLRDYSIHYFQLPELPLQRWPPPMGLPRTERAPASLRQRLRPLRGRTNIISSFWFAGSTRSVDGENASVQEDGEISATSPLLVPAEKRISQSQENLQSFQTTPAHLHLSNHQRQFSTTLNNDTGNESDTNSHCALIIPDEARGSKTRVKDKSTNGNNNYEIHELQELDRIKTNRNRNKIWLRRCVALWVMSDDETVKFPFTVTSRSDSDGEDTPVNQNS